jgi:hypothetical protein
VEKLTNEKEQEITYMSVWNTSIFDTAITTHVNHERALVFIDFVRCIVSIHLHVGPLVHELNPPIVFSPCCVE